VFENLLAKVDAFVIGGGMANTFLAAQGINVGRSLRDPDLLPAQKIIALSLAKGVTLHLPADAVVADAFDADDTARTVPLDGVGDGMILDIGPATAREYAEVLRNAKTIVFNGPMGVYEKPAPAGSAKRSPTRRGTARPASSAAATPRRRRTRSASRMR
jgi:phosphoglycerate kinase